MAEIQSNAVTTKYYYDDASGTPVDITAYVQSCNDIDVSNQLENVQPYGAAFPVFKPTGKGAWAPITLGFLFIIDGVIEGLFAGRIPEASDAVTRTFKIEYGTGRTQAIETHLQSYKGVPNKDNGLTRSQAVLQPTGDITEVIPA